MFNFKNLAKSILMMPRFLKRSIVISVDSSLCVFTVWFAFYLRLGEWIKITGDAYWQPLIAVFVALAIAIPIFLFNGLYQAIFRYSGWSALMTIAKSTGIYAIVFAIIFTAIGIDGVPRTIGLIQPMLLLLTVGASRAFARFWLSGSYRNILKRNQIPAALIYGAGNAGRQLAAVMSNSSDIRIVGFLDDDSKIHGQMLNGLPIFNPDELIKLIETYQVSTVLLALPSASRKRRNEIIAQMLKAKVSVRTLPSLTELVQGKVNLSDVRDLDIDDLLGREPVSPDETLLRKNITDKVVMVTGAGGSIGSELCRQILINNPAKLLLVDQSEFGLYTIHQELINLYPELAQSLVPLLASVCDENRINNIFSAWHPHTVYHAAAYKHVPLVEHNPSEGIKNNVFGTLITAKTAIAYGAENFVLISTDKAVRPTNIMGASKRLAELVLQALASKCSVNSDKSNGNTIFSMVRFGNVLGSSGSVVPKFRQQIRDGGPITLTHPEITRYFMTIPEAAQLVIQASALAENGDVFILDMLEPIKIKDLAIRMIELSGLTIRDMNNPNGDIEISIVGLRHGEKLFEELLISNNPETTKHPRILKAKDDFYSWNTLNIKLMNLEFLLANNDVSNLRTLLKDFVIGYSPNTEVVDWVTLERLNS